MSEAFKLSPSKVSSVSCDGSISVPEISSENGVSSSLASILSNNDSESGAIGEEMIEIAQFRRRQQETVPNVVGIEASIEFVAANARQSSRREKLDASKKLDIFITGDVSIDVFSLSMVSSLISRCVVCVV